MTPPLPWSPQRTCAAPRAEARGHALVGEREARQLPPGEKAARAAHVIENDGTIEDLERSLSALIETLRG